MLNIHPVGMHWLGSVPDSADHCCHGGVRVSRSDELLVDAGGEDFALSTAALHLLRTLYHVHTEEEPIAEHLVPHCGHFMVLDEDSGIPGAVTAKGSMVAASPVT